MNEEIAVEAVWHDGRVFPARINEYGVAIISPPRLEAAEWTPAIPDDPVSGGR